MLSLWSCDQCGLVFADRAVWKDPHSAQDYYGGGHASLEALRAQPTGTHQERVAFVKKWVGSGTLLDYGGGLGETAVMASKMGFSATVIEDSVCAVEAGRHFFPDIEWHCARMIPGDVKNESYDVVTAFHVMEHLVDPCLVLRQFHRILRPGGCLCIEVPNWGSHVRRLRGMDWVFILDHHVNYFDLTTLTSTVEKVGYRFLGRAYRRTFAINEAQRWKEPLKSVLCQFGFGDIVRAMYMKV